MKDVKAFLNYIPSCPKSRGKYTAMYQAAGKVIEYYFNIFLEKKYHCITATYFKFKAH